MKLIKYLLLSFAAILFIACQKDEVLIIQDNAQNLSVNSPLVNLISRVSQNPTSKDNILDNSSCFNIHLPVIVNVDENKLLFITKMIIKRFNRHWMLFQMTMM